MTSNNSNKMTELLQDLNLRQLINEPTHFTENSSSLIDLVLVRNTTNVLTSGVIDSFIPDQTRYHLPIIVLLKFLRPHTKIFKRLVWNYKIADFDRYRTVLSESNLVEKMESTNDIDENVQQFTEILLNAAKHTVPNKFVTIRPTVHPWITSKILNLIRKRKRNFRKFKRTSDFSYWVRYKHIRNKVVLAVRKSKIDYFDKLDDLLATETSNMKLFWKTSKQLLNLSKSSSNIPTLILNNEYAENDIHKANMLNNYFASQAFMTDDNRPLSQLLPVQHVLNSIEILSQDVSDVLRNLNINKSCGPDLVSPRLLKEADSVLARPLSMIFNHSLDQGYFPVQWKHGNVCPIYNKDDKSLPSNYRPITLLSILGKIMERCVHKYLYNFVITNRILTPFQSGFVQGDSTTYQLIHTYHAFCESVDNGKEIRTVFCDISKAFDRVWHRGLLQKLSGTGCSDKIICWFSSYLSGRKQRVVFNGQVSDWTSIQAGVPQSSILGPLLVLIYINDIVSGIRCPVRLFVDSPPTAANFLNSDLSAITNWANTWLVTFNASKTVSMTNSRKANPPQHPPLFMNNVQLTKIDTHKHLGLTFSKSCTWSQHIQNITSKAWARLNLMRSLKFKIKRTALERMYISFIRPVLEYSDSVWDNCSTETKKQLDAVQVEAARIITKLCSINKLFSDIGWDSLQSRRNKHKLVIFYKILNGLTPN